MRRDTRLIWSAQVAYAGLHARLAQLYTGSDGCLRATVHATNRIDEPARAMRGHQ